MDPIPDLAALRPILQSLKAKGLVLSLTPDGRGHVVSHALYEERELEKLRREHQGRSAAGLEDEDLAPAESVRSPLAPAAAARFATAEDVAHLRRELEDAQAEIGRLRKDVDDLRAIVG